MKHLLVGACGLLLVFLVSTAPVFAQSAEYAAATKKARSAFKSEEFLEAAEHFRDAFAAESRGALLYNIGLCYEKAGQIAEAIRYYQRFVDALPGSPKAPTVQRRIAALRDKVGSQYQTVSVTTSPAGATVYVDDRSRGAMGNAPLSFRLLPGEYTIFADLKNHEAGQKKITLEKGQDSSVVLSLMRTDQVGTLKFRISESGADVMLDRRRVGRSPIMDAVRVRSGPHDVLVMKPGFINWAKTVDAIPGKIVEVNVGLRTEADAQLADLDASGSMWPWVVAGVGAAAVGGGVLTGLMAQNLHDGLSEKKKKQELIAASDIDTGNTLVLTTNVLFGVGVAAMLGGAGWYLFESMGIGRNESLDTALIPISEGGAMVQVGGQF